MPEKFSKYSVEDFVKDHDFIHWIKSPDPAQDFFWWNVVENYPFQTEVIQNARQIVLQLSEASRPVHDNDLAGEIWSSLEKEVWADDKSGKIIWKKWMPWMAAASILLAGIILFKTTTLFRNPESLYASLINEANIPVTEVINDSGKTMLVKFPDKSTAELENGSKLSYGKDFTGEKRQVFLSGNAFFNVTKDPSRPFVVYANELVTKVLGTSFEIDALEKGKEVTVSVSTGKVFVFAHKNLDKPNPETLGLTLVPNQKGSFLRQTEMLSRSLVDEPKLVLGPDDLSAFTFENEPLTNIFDALGKAYGVEIVYDKEVLASCRLTTSIGTEELFDQLDVICEAVDAHYKMVDAKIIISGKKCN